MNTEDIVYRLRKRAEIRLNNKDRLSVREGKEDRIANILNEAAALIEEQRQVIENLKAQEEKQYEECKFLRQELQELRHAN